MILDSLSNSAKIESLHPAFKKAFDYVKSLDFSTLEPGKTELEGKNLVVNVSAITGKQPEAARMETHQLFLDIQIPVNAPEVMGWKATCDLKEVSVPYNPEKDVEFFADKPTTYVKVMPGQFAIFFPEDGHAPGIGEGSYQKIIVKIKL
ncbi:MAG: YhcH/YjgK/YiaL family protein [Bacteroidales bacterium]|nr:YhcH/YjgK/YiaL family protein [Bacteroidales bacterium]